MTTYRNLYADGSLGHQWLVREMCLHAGIPVCSARGRRVAIVHVTEKSK